MEEVCNPSAWEVEASLKPAWATQEDPSQNNNSYNQQQKSSIKQELE